MKAMTTNLVALGATLLVGGACGPNVPTSTEAGISYATTEIGWPADVDCVDDKDPTVTKEMLSIESLLVVFAFGANAITDGEWNDYSPSPPFIKNSTRNLEFDETCFWRSPGTSRDCQGEECAIIVEHDDYTWMELAQIVAADCLPADAACALGGSDGHLTFLVTKKCQELVFRGDILELSGPDGERAVMHATADGTPDTTVELPSGWSLEERTLDEDLVVRPFGEGDECFANVIRDGKEQSYHQYRYAGASYPQ